MSDFRKVGMHQKWKIRMHDFLQFYSKYSLSPKMFFCFSFDSFQKCRVLLLYNGKEYDPEEMLLFILGVIVAPLRVAGNNADLYHGLKPVAIVVVPLRGDFSITDWHPGSQGFWVSGFSCAELLVKVSSVQCFRVPELSLLS